MSGGNFHGEYPAKVRGEWMGAGELKLFVWYTRITVGKRMQCYISIIRRVKYNVYIVQECSVIYP